MTPRQDRGARLNRLAVNAQAGQWSAERAIDWRQSARRPFWMTETQVREAVSQLYHGEVATGRLCRRLIGELADPAARRCLELQLADEMRHADVYRRYLDRLGGIAPMDEILARALDAALKGPAATLGAMVAFHVVVEGEALRVQEALARFLPCPLLKQINRLIARDEARHVAFGRIYLAEAVAALPEAARAQLASWLHCLWRQCAEATLADGADRGRIMRGFFHRWLEGGWDRHAAALQQIGVTAPPRGGGSP
jgi:hypothetical protein